MRQGYVNIIFGCKRRRSGGMADASDSKSDAGDCVWVQVPSPAFKKDFIPNGMESFFEAERPMNPGFILRSASVGAKRSSPGRAAPHLLHVRRSMNPGFISQQKVDSAEVRFHRDMLRRQFRHRSHSGYQLQNVRQSGKPL